MRGIPEDIERAATHVCESVGISDSHARKVIAAAILAERKRCAEVARGEAHADCDVAEQIAKAIEAGA